MKPNKLPHLVSKKITFGWGVLASAMMGGLNPPGLHTQLIGMVAYVPLLLLLDQIHLDPILTKKGKLWRSVLTCYGVAIGMSLIGTHWMVHAIHVFGHLDLWLSYLITGLGYGLEVGALLFCWFGLPLFWIRPKGWIDVVLRLLFAVALEPFTPRLIHWSFGGITFSHIPVIEQIADLIGVSGLGFYALGSNFLILLAWRSYKNPLEKQLKIRTLQLGMTYLVLWVMGLGYGFWRIHDLQEKIPGAPEIFVAAIQPNFSVEGLASQPELAYSHRHRSLQGLFSDSAMALQQAPNDLSIPRLLVWPESVYPYAYFQDIPKKQQVEAFAQKFHTSILLQSIDWKIDNLHDLYYGISVLIGPDGIPRGEYRKMFLFPFGEYIPFAKEFPLYRDWIHEQIPEISEFEAGTEYQVFPLDSKIKIGGPICFDALSPQIVRRMVQNGAQFAATLSNLAWYGKSTASDHMAMAIRWNSIENRIPQVHASNNGQSFFINALGQETSPQLRLFQEGVVTQQVIIGSHFSFYREYQEIIHWILAGLTLFLFLWKRGWSSENRPSRHFQ